MKLLDRYVLRNFLEPFLICFFGFISIWLIFDLTNNGSDFIDAHASIKTIAFFYLTQFPQIVLISLPVGLLLAMLFSLSTMSRRNEIISMLTAGISVPRVMLPLIGAGMVASGVLLWLNYELAPHAEAVKKTALEQISRGRKQGEVESVNGYLFRDRMNVRTWYIRRFKPESLQFDGVHITQQAEDGRILKKWYANRAVFDPRTKTWSLNKGMILDFNEAGDIAKMDNFAEGFRVIKDWTETPERIGSSHEDAQNLTVPQLHAYLTYNSDFPAVQLAPFRTYLQHRLAVPFQGLVVIFISGPLAIVFSRRGVLGGVAISMFLYAGLLLSTYFFLALGKGYRLSPEAAAWTPIGFFLAIGMTLLYFRGSNRELPKFGLGKKVKPSRPATP
jgi:lipopolysaccharide export system permease protein